ncbi:MAG: hypothetical protein KGZ69_05255 [Methylomonas sp.]|nr:hypothetical protein [Methylomonas sp.]
MTLYDILVLVLTGLICGGFGFWLGGKASPAPVQTPINSEPTIDANAVKQYVKSIDDFSRLITPAWAAHIENSRQEMERAIGELAQRFGKFQASCRLKVKILCSYFLLVSHLLGRFVLGFGMIRI